MRYHLEVRKVLVVAVGIVAVPAECVEGILFTTRADSQGQVIAATKEVLKASVVQIDETSGYVAVEEGFTGPVGNSFGLICVVAPSLQTLATRERGVHENGLVVTPLTAADLTEAESVAVAVLDVSAVRFVAPAVDVVQINGHEETANLVGCYGTLAIGQLV